MFNFVMIFVSILLGVIGQLLLKKGAITLGGLNFKEPLILIKDMFTNWYLLSGLFFYFVASITWIFALTKVSLSVAYPLLSIGYIFVLVASIIFFKEKVLPIHWVGVLVIMAGVVLITRGR